MSWYCAQVFGDPQQGAEELLDGDIITAVEFNEDGEFLAVGDKAGRVWLYQQQDIKLDGDLSAKDSSRKRPSTRPDTEYAYFLQFQSHEPEFDYLKSLEIEEKINAIKFLKRQSEPLFMISSNGFV